MQSHLHFWRFSAASRRVARCPRRSRDRGWGVSPHVSLSAALVAASLNGACSAAPAPGQTGVAIVGVTVIDVEAGERRPDRTVLIKGPRIERVGPAGGVDVPAGATVVDARGRYLLPGLSDMHVHLYTEGDLLTYLANGITTVRNMAGDATHLTFRRRIAAGEIAGPRIFTSGPVIEGELSHPANARITDPATVRGEVLRQRAMGYDFIKVYNRLSPGVYDELVAVAEEVGLPVSGHVPVEVGLERALAGHRSIEHLRGYLQALVTTPLPDTASFRDRSVAWNDAAIGRMGDLASRTAAAGVWNCPTFAFTVHELSPAAGHARLLSRPELRYLSLSGLPDRSTTAYLKEFDERSYRATQEGLRKQFRLVQALDRAGAGLLVGTDSWLGGFAFADEAALLVQAGLTPARVLRMGTLDAAKYLGRSQDLGTIAPGRLADLVLLDADPLVDITNLRTTRSVVVEGRFFDRAALDAMLARAAADAASRR